MIQLRELRESDAPLMLEWMHDPEMQKGFRKNMLSASLEDAVNFCKSAKIPQVIKDGQSIHYAIVDESDEYLGTISIKNIDLNNLSAEYAISVRKKAQGRGTAFAATGILLKKAFKEYGLHRIYLSVLADNVPAIRLYEKCGFKPEGEFREHIKIDERFVNWKWYGILESEYDENKYNSIC